MKFMRDKPRDTTLRCNNCGAAIAEGHAKFLRPVLVLCGDCKKTQSWHPAPRDKSLDKLKKKTDT